MMGKVASMLLKAARMADEETVRNEIRKEAHAAAFEGVKRYLDGQGFIRCSHEECVSGSGLRRVGISYYCAQHAQNGVMNGRY